MVILHPGPGLVSGCGGAYNPFVNVTIQAYLKDVDRTLLRENLRLSPEGRVRELIALLAAAEEFERAGRRLREEE